MLFKCFIRSTGLDLFFILGQTPKANVEVKDLGVEISKDGGTKPSILVKLQLLPVIVYLGEPRISFDQSSSFSNGESFNAGSTCFATNDKASAPFVCEEFHLACEFGHDRLVLSLFYIIFLYKLMLHFVIFKVMGFCMFFPPILCSSSEVLVVSSYMYICSSVYFWWNFNYQNKLLFGIM